MISETYPEEYLDIDFLSNVLFNNLYNHENDSKKCYEMQPIDTKNISILDIKLLLEKQRQKKLVNNIFNTKINWLWRKNNKYMFKRSMDVYSTNIQLQIIQKNDEQVNLKSINNIHSLITWLLSDLVIMRKTKGILLNLMTVDIDFDLLEEFIDNFQEIAPDFLQIQNKKDKVINVVISEHFFKTELLNNIILDLTWNQLKSIIFQVAHTLAIIQSTYNGFRHNNLLLDSIFLYIKKPKFNTYVLNDQQIQMNDEGFEVKITSFEKSFIPNIAENDDISNINKELNNTYDILYFLEEIANKVKDDFKENIKFIIKNIKKNDKNILLSNIIMTDNFLNIQKGGDKKSKSRIIKGVRYLSNSDVFVKSENRTINELPDSLSSDSDQSEKYKFSDESSTRNIKKSNFSMNPMGMAMNPMGMPMSSGMPMNPMGMPMSSGMSMNPMGMPMSSGMSINPMNSMGMPMNMASMSNFAGDPSLSNDQLMKLGMIPPNVNSGLAKTSADIGNFKQMGGNDDMYIDIAHPNFFF
jgi:hypothetical protein